MQYSLVGNEDGSRNITVFAKGGVQVAHSTHPNFDKIVEGVVANDSSVLDLFNISQTITNRFEKLSERVSVANGQIHFDGEVMDNALSSQILRFLDQGVEDFKPLVAFYENIEQNPQEDSRKQLYRWLAAEDFGITEDGLIVGYKGVQPDGDGYLSIQSGRATVDGVVHDGRIPNKLGSVVEMPRGEVTHDPNRGCSTGLHVGTWEYAEGFANGAVLTVHVNPRDVVSVPGDSGGQKMRVCRYTVEDAVDTAYKVALIYARDDEDDEDDDEVSPYWGDLDDEGTDDQVEEEVEDLDDEVVVGDVFEDRDSRRAGRSFKVESIEGDHAVGKSLPSNLTRKVRLDRLTSRKYRKV